MKMEPRQVTNPLTVRLLRRVLFVSLTLLLCLAGVRSWWEYRQAQTDLGKRMSTIELTLTSALSNSVWDFNLQQVALQLEGIRNTPGMNYVAVQERGQVLAESGARKHEDVLVREVPLMRMHEGRLVPLGTLVMQADLAVARDQAFTAMLLSLGLDASLIILLTLAFFLLSRGMISRHLTAAAHYFQRQGVSPETKSFQPLRLDKKNAGDELDVLCMAVNDMQEKLARSHAQAWSAEQEARSQARFPEENPNPVLRLNVDGLVVFANSAGLKFFAPGDCTPGHPLPAVFDSAIRQALATAEMQQFEVGDAHRTFAFVARPLLSEGYVNIYGMDVTERKQAMEAVSRSLAEKEVLLKEIHHRVKNNLQIVSSLLYLQAEYVYDPRDSELFSESQKRIQAMALVHEELYGANDLSSVDMSDYVPRLVERVLASANSPVQLECRVDPVQLPLTQCIPCGLALNELVMNAAKHAFGSRPQEGRANFLGVTLRCQDERIVLEICDNGPGLPPNFDIHVTPTLGMTLLTSLTQQLGGNVTARNGSPGACFCLEFPAKTA